MSQSSVTRYLTLVACCAAIAALGASCGNDESVSGIDGPSLVTDVEELVFVQVSLDETDTQSLTIMNVGKGDLHINGIKLVEETLDDAGGEEFFKGANWVNEAVLATNDAMVISVEYTPTDRSPDLGYIEIVSNDPEQPNKIVRLETPALAPRIFSKESVIFRRVPPVDAESRNMFWQLTEVQNIGQAPLNLNDIVVSPVDGDFSITFPTSLDPNVDPSMDATDYPRTLAPDESFPIRVFFNPTDSLPSTAELVFFSNDPNSPEYVVSLVGNSGSPCLQLNEEDEINFGEGAIGFANNKTIIIENCSPTSDLEVRSIDVCTFVDGGDCSATAGTYAIKDGSLPAGLPDADAVIGPQDTASFVLTYTPEDLSQSTGELTVGSNDPAKANLVVPIVGKGTNNQCPTAIAAARVQDSSRWQNEIATIPLKTIQFQGTNSVDPDGSVARYEWNLISRPTNSTTRFNPSANVAEPTLFLDLAGEYVVELRVYDDKNTQSCGDQAIVTIRATPDEDIHIQLVWDTPTDPDQTDILGTDVDLHFLHPNGDWNTAPYDVYWLNPTSDWGLPGPSDDPSLDIDDIDGAGPENINLTAPESGLVYAVGVYYYGDSGFGPSYATTRIFVRGVQEFEHRDMYLPAARYFWYVGTISWPSGQVFTVNQVQQGFPQR